MRMLTALAIAAILPAPPAAPLAAGSAPPGGRWPSPAAACAIGRAVLDDLAASARGRKVTLIHPDARVQTVEIGAAYDPRVSRPPPRTSLFAACPALARDLPADLRFATPANLAASSNHVIDPPGGGSTWTQVTAVSAPWLAGRDMAHLVLEVGCSGLCGSGSLLTLVKDGRGHWRVRGSQLMWVS